MSENLRLLVQYRLREAHETLREAELLLNSVVVSGVYQSIVLRDVLCVTRATGNEGSRNVKAQRGD
ncbi:MAG: hypothetical protein HC795_19315 [Coleofasciculaceae cyanobacterium RL_1_1]|nr:hypothetical protein [Coleofasciculaceae cyanobacterium RL_1_1]